MKRENKYDAKHLADVDVLVVGGGFPGICAALAAFKLLDSFREDAQGLHTGDSFNLLFLFADIHPFSSHQNLIVDVAAKFL